MTWGGMEQLYTMTEEWPTKKLAPDSLGNNPPSSDQTYPPNRRWHDKQMPVRSQSQPKLALSIYACLITPDRGTKLASAVTRFCVNIFFEYKAKKSHAIHPVSLSFQLLNISLTLPHLSSTALTYTPGRIKQSAQRPVCHTYH